MDIKEAAERTEMVLDYANSDNKDCVLLPRDKIALSTLISIAEKVEKAKGVLPKKKKVKVITDDIIIGREYNQAINDCKLYIAKMLDGSKEICICAAVIAEDGSVYRGHRHSDAFDTLVRNKKKPKPGMKHQGFITSKNRYVGRDEGARLQREAGIKSVWVDGYVKDTLFSEDLY